MTDSNEPFRLTRTSTTGGCAAKVGPGELGGLLAGLPGIAHGARRAEVIVGAETGDDAGAFRFGGRALIATIDFIPPLCDDPRRFGRIAAANALSDVWAMGGEPLFALNVCAFPDLLPDGVAAAILAGGAEALEEAGAALLGGHSIRDKELKYGLAVVGDADPERLLANSGARPGDRLILTKPLGSGVLVNAFRSDRIGAAELEPALAAMERLNGPAARIALAHGATAATDVTGFGLAGHAWNIARESKVRFTIDFDALPVHPGFYDLARAGVSTGCTPKNRAHVEARLERIDDFAPEELELIFDPQTSGGLLLAIPPDRAEACLAGLVAAGIDARLIGRAAGGEPALSLRRGGGGSEAAEKIQAREPARSE